MKVRDASTQTERIGVPEEHLGGHAFHTYRWAPAHISAPAPGCSSLEPYTLNAICFA